MLEKSFDSRNIEENVRRVLAEVEEAALRAGRDPNEIQVMAVTKTNPPEAINRAIRSGIKLIGENRVQEMLSKIDGIALGDCALHLIGHLQTNKVKLAAPHVSMIESVDSVRLAREISVCSEKLGKRMPVLVEVNIGREESKSGILLEALFDFLCEIAEFPGISVQGLMAIPPITDDLVQNEQFFELMHGHFIDMQAKKIDNINMTVLSMGMSRDYPLAVRHGSGIVRVGRAIFGERN